MALEAFDALFNRRDFEAAERYWSPGYVPHLDENMAAATLSLTREEIAELDDAA